MSDIKKVVLAYSGGLDTSVILKWLDEPELKIIEGYCQTNQNLVRLRSSSPKMAAMHTVRLGTRQDIK